MSFQEFRTEDDTASQEFRTEDVTAFQEFRTELMAFVGQLESMFPGCPQIATLSNQTGFLCASDGALGLLIDGWHKYVETPLPDAKYSKPLNRILNRGGDTKGTRLYHALAYGDTAVAFQYPNGVFDKIGLEAKLSDPNFSADRRAAVLGSIHALHGLIYCLQGGTPPTVPSREELAEEIRTQKAKKKSKVGQTGKTQQTGSEKASQPGEKGQGGFAQGFTQLVEIGMRHGKLEDVEGRALIQEIETSERDMFLEWDAAMKQTTTDDGISIYDLLCQERYSELPAFTDGICTQVPLQALLLEDSSRKETKELVEHINILTRVQSQVPKELRCRIERVAERIATDIAQGSMSMADIDLAKIGEDVLQDCEPEDLTALAGGISSLLPMVAKMQQNLPPNVDPMMLATLLKDM